jgi:hypothetical protein
MSVILTACVINQLSDIRKDALLMASVFGSTCPCKQLEDFEDCVQIGVTGSKSDIERLLKHVGHCQVSE